jgi:hypothetical protein
VNVAVRFSSLTKLGYSSGCSGSEGENKAPRAVGLPQVTYINELYCGSILVGGSLWEFRDGVDTA